MHPEAIDSGALNESCQMKRNDSSRPKFRVHKFPSVSIGAAGLAAWPRPIPPTPDRRRARTPRRRIQPSMACGPPGGADDQRDRDERSHADHVDHVQRGGLRTGRCRESASGRAGPSSGLMSHAQQIDVQANRARHAKRQLAEEGVAGVDVIAFAVLRQQQAALLRLLAGIVATPAAACTARPTGP